MIPIMQFVLRSSRIKSSVFAVLAGACLLFATGVTPARASTVTQAVSATVTDSTGVLSGYMHLFDVTYDPADTEFHQYDIATGVVYTYQVSDYAYMYASVSDATFEWSADVIAWLAANGGHDQFEEAEALVWNNLNGNISFNWNDIDDLLSMGTYFTQQWGYIQAYTEEDVYEELSFNDWSMTTIDATATVPEPSTILLLGVGLLGFAGVGRKKRH